VDSYAEYVVVFDEPGRFIPIHTQYSGDKVLMVSGVWRLAHIKVIPNSKTSSINNPESFLD